MKRLLTAALLGLMAAVAHAQPRWCSVIGLGPGQNLGYPPIARAARVSGHVMERVIYSPGKGAIGFEHISGPHMLSAGLEKQMADWTILTSAKGDAPCMTLVIADFKFDESVTGKATRTTIDTSIPSILQIQVSMAAPVIIIETAGKLVEEAPLRSQLAHDTQTLPLAFARRD